MFKWTKTLSILKAISSYGRDAFDSDVVRESVKAAQMFTIDEDDCLENTPQGLHRTFPDGCWNFLCDVDCENPGKKLKPFDPLSKRVPKPKPPRLFNNPPEDLEIVSLLSAWTRKDPQATCVSASNPLWILKPAGKSRGRGIRLANKLEEILQVAGRTETMWVVQKYVENPLLINGRKFDIRKWALITQWDPLAVWFYEDCYLRLTFRDYDPVKVGDTCQSGRQIWQKSLQQQDLGH